MNYFDYISPKLISYLIAKGLFCSHFHMQSIPHALKIYNTYDYVLYVFNHEDSKGKNMIRGEYIYNKMGEKKL